jgi:membrane-associated phospholipid phosphatase
MTGFDWWYYLATRIPTLLPFTMPAAVMIFYVPVLLPMILLYEGWRWKREDIQNLGYALAQSEFLAFALTCLYKFFTGREHPPIRAYGVEVADISRVFHFGFDQGGLFWGWPSSHTAIAFALAATIFMLSHNRKVRLVAAILALYVGLSVSTTIPHWFSDFAAGAILGTVVGTVVGNAFKKRLSYRIMGE